MKQKFGIRGRARVEVRDAAGNTVWVNDDHNLITNVGIAALSGLWNGVVTDKFRYVALGTGVAPADTADTALGTEVDFGGGSRKLGDTIDQTTDVLEDDTARVIAEFTITQGFDLSEIGLFNAASVGVLGAHRVFSPVTLSPGQTVIVTWTLTLASA